MRVTAQILCTAVVLAAVGFSGTASAEDTAERAWAKGVAKDDQTKALALFNEGNTMLEQRKCKEAMTKYREAVKSWDHPAIRYNMALCMVQFEQFLDAYRSLEKAVAFGEAPLGATLFTQAENYQKLLEGRISHLEVSCEQKGVTVTLDGEPLVSCPGKATRLLLSGVHQLVAEKNTFLTYSGRLNLPPGEVTKKTIKLVSLDEAVTFERRWETWKPWVVVGGGLALAAAGTGFYALAGRDISNYESDLSEQCPSGCLIEEPAGGLQAGQTLLSASVTRLKDSARTNDIIAFSLWGVGGAMAVAGAVLVFMNQPHAMQPEQPAGAGASPGPRVQVIPVLAPEQAGIALSMSF